MRIFGSLDVILEEKLAFKNYKILGSKSTNELVPYLENSEFLNLHRTKSIQYIRFQLTGTVNCAMSFQ